jgi:hypothetical protein
MGKASRDKGARFERYVVSTLKLVFPDARRGRQYDSARECDVEGTPVRIECKAYKTWPDVYAALEQCDGDGNAVGDERPVAAITKKDRTQPLVSMFLVDFVKFCEENLYSPREPGELIQGPWDGV